MEYDNGSRLAPRCLPVVDMAGLLHFGQQFLVGLWSCRVCVIFDGGRHVLLFGIRHKERHVVVLLGRNLKDGAVHHPEVSNLLVRLNLLLPHQQNSIAIAVRLVEG